VVVVVVGAVAFGSFVVTVAGLAVVVDDDDEDEDEDDDGPKSGRGSAITRGSESPAACTSTAGFPRPDGRVTATTAPRTTSATTPAAARRGRRRASLTIPLSEPVRAQWRMSRRIVPFRGGLRLVVVL
jgi:hypothetical protein